MKNIVTNKLDTPWYYIGPNVVFGGLSVLTVAICTMGLVGAIGGAGIGGFPGMIIGALIGWWAGAHQIPNKE